MIRDAIRRLIYKNLFFANAIMLLKVSYDEKCPTAGVSFHDDQFNLIVNPKFWATLSLDEQVAVLEHEVLHIAFNHPARIREVEPRIFNLAADATINQYINNLPKRGVCKPCKKDYPSKDKKCLKCGKDLEIIKNYILPETFKLPNEKNTEYYYDALMKQAEKISVNIKSLDDHSGWDKKNEKNSSKHAKSTLEGAARDLIKQAHELSNKSWGDMPYNLQREILKALETKLNWQEILRQFLYRATLTLKVSSRKKRNKRYGPIYPAHKNYPKLSVLVGIDTSGSISPYQLNMFFAQLKAINVANIEVEVAECDAEIHKTYKYDPRKKLANFSGGGGTSFQPVFDYAKKTKPDCIIYLTDGYDGGTARKPSIPVLWGVTSDGSVSYKWGQQIRLPKENE